MRKHIRKLLAVLCIASTALAGYSGSARLAQLALIATAWVLYQTSPAFASNCAAYTFTLTNGQTADANQVMTNFNTIMSCANSTLAHNGANSDITSLSGLTTPLSVGAGGTGLSTLPTGSLVIGNGATAPTFLAPGAANNVLQSNGSAWVSAAALSQPAFRAAPSASLSIANGGGGTKVHFNTVAFDTTSNYDGVTNFRYTPPAGIYQVNVSGFATGLNVATGGELVMSLNKNGTLYGACDSDQTAGTNAGCTFSDLVQMNGTDFLEVVAATSNSVGGGTLSTSATSFSAARVSN